MCTFCILSFMQCFPQTDQDFLKAHISMRLFEFVSITLQKFCIGQQIIDILKFQYEFISEVLKFHAIMNQKKLNYVTKVVIYLDTYIYAARLVLSPGKDDLVSKHKNIHFCLLDARMLSITSLFCETLYLIYIGNHKC